MYIIKITNETNINKCWVGHSNSSICSGFHLTDEDKARIFIREINDVPKLKEWLDTKNYSYDIIEVKDKKHRRAY